MHLLMVPAMMFAACNASAAVWQWGCMGRLGDDQIVFNRDRLLVIAGRAAVGNLDDFVRRGDFAAAPKRSMSRSQAIATYQPDDANGGLEASMTFSREDAGGKLILTELSSRKIGHSGRLVASCRDETVDRFRKTYRLERSNEPPRTVDFVCMEYQLSTRGGRTCR